MPKALDISAACSRTMLNVWHSGGELSRLDGVAYANPLVEHQRLMAADKPYRAAFLSVAQVMPLLLVQWPK